VKGTEAVSGDIHENLENKTEGESVDDVGEHPFPDVDTEENDPEQDEAESGLSGHPAGIPGENVGSEYRVDPQHPPAAAFIEDARCQQDDKESKEAADESDAMGEVWIEESEIESAKKYAECGVDPHNAPSNR